MSNITPVSINNKKVSSDLMFNFNDNFEHLIESHKKKWNISIDNDQNINNDMHDQLQTTMPTDRAYPS